MRKLYPVVGLFIFVLVFSGCDQISDILGDYFPSMKKEKIVVIPTEKKIAAKPTIMTKDTLAKVGSWTITLVEFNEKLKNLKEVLPEYDGKDVETKKLVLEELVRQQLLVKAAEEKGIQNKKEIKAAMDEFRKTLLVRELAVQLTENVKATEQDAKDFYAENEDMFREVPQWRIREILVPDEAKAKELLIGLLQGEDFATLATANSITTSAANGGDIGFVSEFADPQVQNMVFSLEPGSTSSVFKGEKGYYIIKLEEQKGGELQPLETVKQELIEGLTAMKQQEAVVGYIEKLKSQTDVQINEDLLK
ncbi:MAG: peptidyl-prolyl cis-trans isomerase [Candidatus Aceula meridiana]|nr:peptidyl-prolyl cis-trans isomerase [Candidatus Aceula meridiana]